MTSEGLGCDAGQAVIVVTVTLQNLGDDEFYQWLYAQVSTTPIPASMSQPIIANRAGSSAVDASNIRSTTPIPLAASESMSQPKIQLHQQNGTCLFRLLDAYSLFRTNNVSYCGLIFMSN